MGNFVLEIEDVKYQEFLEFCKLNSITPETFITKAFLEKYMLLKYGDLNEKVSGTVNDNKKQEKKPKKTTKKTDDSQSITSSVKTEYTVCKHEGHLVNQGIKMCNKELPNEANIGKCGPDCPCYEQEKVETVTTSATTIESDEQNTENKPKGKTRIIKSH